jgi:hypothetical protein
MNGFSDRYDEPGAGDFSDPSLRQTEPKGESMKCIGDDVSVNLSTGERQHEVVGDGERSRIVKCVGCGAKARMYALVFTEEWRCVFCRFPHLHR